MKRFLFILTVAALAFVGVQLHSAAPAQAVTTYPCFGVPAEYVAAFDTVRGQPADGKVTYNERRWYDEQQSWATPGLTQPGHHSDHVHMGRCIPNGKKSWVTKNRPIDVEYTFHNDTSYTVVSAGSQYLWGDANAGPTALAWSATPDQIAELQAGVDVSGDGNVAHVFQSYAMAPPPVNGFKEIRTSISFIGRDSAAVFPKWALDTRWYETDNIPGLATAAGIGGQIAVRNRSIVTFVKPASTGGGTQNDYHHSGWCGMNGVPFGATQTAGSALFTATRVSTPWVGDQTVCLYVTDGGGPATLMIDPDFHHHYDAPTAACPNVDANGNCLGVWYWQPSNSEKSIFSGPGSPQNIPVTIPGSVIAGLAPGPHRLVFKSDDEAECFRRGLPCPSDVRGTWTNISVLPFTR